MASHSRGKEMNREEKAREARKYAMNGVSPVYKTAAGIFAGVSFVSILSCFLIFGYYHQKAGESVKEEEAVEALSTSTDIQFFSKEEVDKLVQEASGTAATVSEQKLLDTIKSRLLDGEGTLAVFRDMYPDNIVMLDGGQYLFLPILEDLKKHDYRVENVVMNEDSTISYVEDEAVVSRKGIDVSKYQGNISWEKVAQDGVEYAFIRLGIRGYSEGAIKVDETFSANIQGAIANGMDVGVYFFTQAVSDAEALEEAQFVIENLAPYAVNFPVVLDVEAVGGKEGRTNNLTVAERTQYAVTFCEAIKEAGYTPMIYGNLKTFMLMLDMEKLEDYEKWFAGYDPTKIYFPYDFSIWQYTDTGRVDGINGDVDLNITFGKW